MMCVCVCVCVDVCECVYGFSKEGGWVGKRSGRDAHEDRLLFSFVCVSVSVLCACVCLGVPLCVCVHVCARALPVLVLATEDAVGCERRDI